MSREVLKVQFIPRRVVQNRPFNIIIIFSIIIREPFKFYFLSVPSPIIALPCQSLLYVCTWICKDCYMYFFTLLNGFVKIDTWISLCWYMDL